MSKQKRIPGDRQDSPEDCLYCPHYRVKKRGCKRKNCTGGGERRGNKPHERRRKRWAG